MDQLIEAINNQKTAMLDELKRNPGMLSNGAWIRHLLDLKELLAMIEEDGDGK